MPTPTIKPTAQPTLELLSTPTPSDQKDPERIVFTGVIKDDNGKPMAGYIVILHSDPMTTITDENGVFTFRNVPLTHHTLIVEDKDGEEIGNYLFNLVSGDEPEQEVLGEEVNIVYTKAIANIETVLQVSKDNQSVVLKDIKVNEEVQHSKMWIICLLVIVIGLSGLAYCILKKRQVNK